MIAADYHATGAAARRPLLVAPQFHNVVAGGDSAHIAGAVHLVRPVEDDRPGLDRFSPALHVRLDRPLDDDDDFLVDVPVGRVGLDADAENRLVGLDVEPAVRLAHEEAAA